MELRWRTLDSTDFRNEEAVYSCFQRLNGSPMQHISMVKNWPYWTICGAIMPRCQPIQVRRVLSSATARHLFLNTQFVLKRNSLKWIVHRFFRVIPQIWHFSLFYEIGCNMLCWSFLYILEWRDGKDDTSLLSIERTDRTPESTKNLTCIEVRWHLQHLREVIY